MSRDASLIDGGEVISPILGGVDGLEAVRDILRAIKRAEASAGTLCGFHVHIDVSDFTSLQIKNLLKFYIKHEYAIDCFVPRWRRRSRCEYARSFRRKKMLAQFFAVDAEPDPWAIFQNVQDGSRFFKLNLSPVERIGTIEIRHQSGTLSEAVAIPWILTGLALAEHAKKNKVLTDTRADDIELITRLTRNRRVAEMLRAVSKRFGRRSHGNGVRNDETTFYIWHAIKSQANE